MRGLLGSPVYLPVHDGSRWSRARRPCGQAAVYHALHRAANAYKARVCITLLSPPRPPPGLCGQALRGVMGARPGAMCAARLLYYQLCLCAGRKRGRVGLKSSHDAQPSSAPIASPSPVPWGGSWMACRGQEGRKAPLLAPATPIPAPFRSQKGDGGWRHVLLHALIVQRLDRTGPLV